MRRSPRDRHNDALVPLMKVIVLDNSEAEQWVIMESLCLCLGYVHGRTDRQIAEFVETIASRIATGERNNGGR
jgi:hypothetical protein